MNTKKVLLVLAMSLSLAGCSTKTEVTENPSKTNQENDGEVYIEHKASESKPDTIKGTVGDSLTFNGIKITLNSTDIVENPSDPQEAYIICNITVQNDSDSKIYMYSDEFLLQNLNGEEINPMRGTTSHEDGQVFSSFDGFYLGKGGTYTGKLTYIDENLDGDFLLNYYDGGFYEDQPSATWSFKTSYPESEKSAEYYNSNITTTINTKEPQKLKIGETGDIDGLKITVKNVEIFEENNDDIYNILDPEKKYVLFTVELKNETEHRINYISEHQWTLSTGDGVEITRVNSYPLVDIDPLTDGRLAQGGSTEGIIGFIINKSDQDLRLNYYGEEPKWGNPLIDWEVDS